MNIKKFKIEADYFHFVSLLRNRGIPHISLIKSDYGVKKDDFTAYYPFPATTPTNIINWLSNDVKLFDEQPLKWTIENYASLYKEAYKLEATDREGNLRYTLFFTPEIGKIWYNENL